MIHTLQKGKFIFQPLILRCYVCFREGILLSTFFWRVGNVEKSCMIHQKRLVDVVAPPENWRMSLNNSGWKTTFLLTGPCVGDTLIFLVVLLYIEYIDDNDVSDYLNLFDKCVFICHIWSEETKILLLFTTISFSHISYTRQWTMYYILYIYIYICFFTSIILREMCIGKYMWIVHRDPCKL